MLNSSMGWKKIFDAANFEIVCAKITDTSKNYQKDKNGTGRVYQARICPGTTDFIVKWIFLSI